MARPVFVDKNGRIKEDHFFRLPSPCGCTGGDGQRLEICPKHPHPETLSPEQRLAQLNGILREAYGPGKIRGGSYERSSEEA